MGLPSCTCGANALGCSVHPGGMPREYWDRRRLSQATVPGPEEAAAEAEAPPKAPMMSEPLLQAGQRPPDPPPPADTPGLLLPPGMTTGALEAAAGSHAERQRAAYGEGGLRRRPRRVRVFVAAVAGHELAPEVFPEATLCEWRCGGAVLAVRHCGTLHYWPREQVRRVEVTPEE